MAKSAYSLANSLQTFKGSKEENLNFFLNNLEQIAQLEKWDNKKKSLILKLNLAGEALKVVSEAKTNVDMEYECIVKLLKDKFSRKLSYTELQSKFNSLIQKPNQSIRNLIEEVEKATDEYLEINGDSNEQTLSLARKMKSQKLLDSMRPDIRIEVMKRGASNFNEIGKIAIDIENAISMNEAHLNNVTKSSEIEILLRSQIESNKKIEELTQKINDLTKTKSVNNISQSNKLNQPKITCHICSRNHITTECWYYPKNYNVNNKFKPYERSRSSFRRGFNRNFRKRGNNSTDRRQNNLN